MANHETITANELAEYLGLSPRTVRKKMFKYSFFIKILSKYGLTGLLCGCYHVLTLNEITQRYENLALNELAWCRALKFASL